MRLAHHKVTNDCSNTPEIYPRSKAATEYSQRDILNSAQRTFSCDISQVTSSNTDSDVTFAGNRTVFASYKQRRNFEEAAASTADVESKRRHVEHEVTSSTSTSSTMTAGVQNYVRDLNNRFSVNHQLFGNNNSNYNNNYSNNHNNNLVLSSSLTTNYWTFPNEQPLQDGFVPVIVRNRLQTQQVDCLVLFTYL